MLVGIAGHLESIAMRQYCLGPIHWRTEWSLFQAIRDTKQKLRLGSVSPGAEIIIQGPGPVGLAYTLLASLAGA